jgi:hypothetical protein
MLARRLCGGGRWWVREGTPCVCTVLRTALGLWVDDVVGPQH